MGAILIASGRVPKIVITLIGFVINFHLHHLVSNRIISKPLQSSELGCGSLYMSVGDYYKFMYGLQSGQLVGEAGLKSLADNFQIKYSAGVSYVVAPSFRVKV
ncbi:hypothetical protein WP50_25405 [Lactiplantibacillus plantarum]|nr:hypothetical protein WP50_25405 [Lactiplantibacillus plantarum]